ncbi:MAG: nuclear transport factor 2 family protein [Phycisphaeraceae bacterium]|nr:nuclear transport factor 2 family protein [Phycisphaeraceae bacterium]
MAKKKSAKANTAKHKGNKKSVRTATKKKSAAPKKNSAKSNSLAPVAIKTGPGMTPMEIGSKLVADFNAGKMHLTDMWSPAIVSIEGVGVSQAWRGRKAVDAKNAWWASEHTIHGASAEGPFVGATGFSVKFVIDVETKATAKREIMTEVGVYTVKNGKIVQEEFMYRAG